MKVFNTTAVCIPSKHYMVDLSERVSEIRKLVDAGKYFTINRARQYGKTTTLSALKKALVKDYLVLALDFLGIGAGAFDRCTALVDVYYDSTESEWNKISVDIKNTSIEQARKHFGH